MKTFLTGIAGFLIGMVVSSIIRDGEINWDTTGILIALTVLVLLFSLGFHLYKKYRI